MWVQNEANWQTATFHCSNPIPVSQSVNKTDESYTDDTNPNEVAEEDHEVQEEQMNIIYFTFWWSFFITLSCAALFWVDLIPGFGTASSISELWNMYVGLLHNNPNYLLKIRMRWLNFSKIQSVSNFIFPKMKFQNTNVKVWHLTSDIYSSFSTITRTQSWQIWQLLLTLFFLF